ncbi:olfactory receptor 4B13-like [Genypterus blacodes]|uniref:olfactory receptor 4B13-like n=1 Tax=Genypterus blacodes TaxID=154954 RepID=UPI003F761E18
MDNGSTVTVFTLAGLNVNMNYRIVLFCLTLLCYCVILLVNISLVVTIILDRSLHEPMYILLCAFCMNGLYGTTGFYPKFLVDLLSPVHVISYSGCLVQALVVYSYAFSDLSILSVMAFDRYLAICRPLQYVSIMTRQRLIQLVCFSWITPFCIISINILLTSRLKLCGSKINKLFCVNWMIVKLACVPSVTTVNTIVAYVTILVYVCLGFLIVWSYIFLIKTCLNSLESRKKFTQTCVPHLASLITFAVAIVFDVMHMRFGSANTSQPLQNFIAIEFILIPPFINPLIYGFKLSKIRNRMQGFINIQILVYKRYLAKYRPLQFISHRRTTGGEQQPVLVSEITERTLTEQGGLCLFRSDRVNECVAFNTVRIYGCQVPLLCSALSVRLAEV